MTPAPFTVEQVEQHAEWVERTRTVATHPATAPMLRAFADSMRPRTCVWREDEDGVWHTGCGEAWQFTTDGPTENSQRFCGYCGAHIDARKADR
jgi:hypothetical protein